jgi:Major intrinsic protein.
VSGASVNPARSIGSALLGQDLTALWIYIIAPIVGAVGGWAVFRAIDGGGEEPLS